MYYLALTTAFALTSAMLVALVPVAGRMRLLDNPGGRKDHEIATPMVGGIGIFLGLLMATTLVPGLLFQFAPLLSLAALVLLVGVIDDAKGLSANMRMSAHALIALSMAVVAGVQLHSLGNLVGGSQVFLGVMAIPLTVFATCGVINAINMSDGIDGLSGGMVLITLGCIGLAAVAGGEYGTATFSALLICALVAFLLLNYRHPWNKRAIVYMGDAGSTTMGFILAWLLIDSSQGPQAICPPVIALWFLAVPLMDTVNLLIKRPLRGLSPFHAGHDHLHHQLLRRGWSVQQVVSVLMVAAIFMGAVGMAGLLLGVRQPTMFAGFLLLFVAYFFLVERIAPQNQPARA